MTTDTTKPSKQTKKELIHESYVFVSALATLLGVNQAICVAVNDGNVITNYLVGRVADGTPSPDPKLFSTRIATIELEDHEMVELNLHHGQLVDTNLEFFTNY